MGDAGIRMSTDGILDNLTPDSRTLYIPNPLNPLTTTTMKYAYYPGCSLECNAAAYDDSVREVADLLGIKLQTLDDWNCCGATEYFSQDELTACAVIARNLALVDPQIDQLVAPCAACYLNLKKTDRLMSRPPGDWREGEPVPGRRRIELQAGPRDRASHARRDRRRHRRGGRPRQGGSPVDGPPPGARITAARSSARSPTATAPSIR